MKVKFSIFILAIFFFSHCAKERKRPPLITTDNVYPGLLSVKCGGILYAQGDQNVTEKGLCWSKLPDPTINDNKMKIGEGEGNFTGVINGLKAYETYYVRAYAINNYGASYGMSIKFKPYGSTVTDIDGNVYHTVVIGNQEWMTSNLKVSRYNNGDPIDRIDLAAQWISSVGGAYCYYNNDPSNELNCGKIYNWYAATDIRKIAPIGWHVPTDAELNQLNIFLVDSIDFKLKDVCCGGYNTTGFSDRPTGSRSGNDGLFYGLGTSSWYWSSSENQPTNNNALLRGFFANPSMWPYNLKKVEGASIRCVKD